MFKDVFVKLLQSKNLNVNQLAKELGLSQGLLNNYKLGNRSPTQDNLRKIADYFGVSVDYLLGRESANIYLTEKQSLTDEERALLKIHSKLGMTQRVKLLISAINLEEETQTLPDNSTTVHRPGREHKAKPAVAKLSKEPTIKKEVKTVQVIDMDEEEYDEEDILFIGDAEDLTDDDFYEPDKERIRIKVYSQPAAAGLGNYLTEDCDRNFSLYSYNREDIPRGADFGIRIDGDSMEPKIMDKAVVWIRYQQRVESGEIGIFIVGEDAYCKKLHVTYDENQRVRRVELVSINESCKPIVIKQGDKFHTVGKVLL